MIDEYDTFIHNNEELRGALNAGHKRGGIHLRCEGDKNEVRGFRTFAPVALAGIRELPGTLSDRSIIIQMQRMGADEWRQPFDQRRTEPEKILCRKLARWARDNFPALEAADPGCLRERGTGCATTGDRCSPSPRWPAATGRHVSAGRSCCSGSRMTRHGPGRRCCCRTSETCSPNTAIGSCRRMRSSGWPKWKSGPWPEYSRGKPITARQVAAALRRFEIKPVLVRTGAEVARGYVKDDFTNAFKRYPPSDPLHRYNVDGARVVEDFDPLQAGNGVTDRKSPEAKQDAGCNGVTDRKGGIGGEREVITI